MGIKHNTTPHAEERNLIENKVLRRIFEPKRNKMA
jgi:hypothetical protein